MSSHDDFIPIRGDGVAIALKRLGEGTVQVSTEVRKGEGVAGDGHRQTLDRT